MFFEYNADEGYTEVNCEVDDACLLCNLYDLCPLIGAIENNIVYPSSNNLYVASCSLYEPVDYAEN